MNTADADYYAEHLIRDIAETRGLTVEVSRTVAVDGEQWRVDARSAREHWLIRSPSLCEAAYELAERVRFEMD